VGAVFVGTMPARGPRNDQKSPAMAAKRRAATKPSHEPRPPHPISGGVMTNQNTEQDNPPLFAPTVLKAYFLYSAMAIAIVCVPYFFYGRPDQCQQKKHTEPVASINIDNQPTGEKRSDQITILNSNNHFTDMWCYYRTGSLHGGFNNQQGQ
jgi:hypothetical protein